MEDTLTLRAFVARPDSDSSEIEIVEAARTDAGAFGELYERYYARVYRYVFHRIGNASDAEDVTALVFMKALEGLPGYRPHRGGFAPWLFRITRNAVVDHYRRGKRQTPLLGFDHEDHGADPVTHVMQGEQRAELRSLVECLSPDQREVVLMRYAADLSFAEIAAVLGKQEPAVRMLLHRGLRKLKAVMDHE